MVIFSLNHHVQILGYAQESCTGTETTYAHFLSHSFTHLMHKNTLNLVSIDLHIKPLYFHLFILLQGASSDLELFKCKMKKKNEKMQPRRSDFLAISNC